MENENAYVKASRVTLKTVADHLGLTAGTISAVLNNSPAGKRIPQHTRERIRTAAREMNYQPNPLARALRTGESFNRQTSESSSPRALVIAGKDEFERALTAIRQAGLRVPDDVSVLDFCDVPAAAFGYPSLTFAPKPT